MAGASSWQEGGPSRGTDSESSLDGEAHPSGGDTNQVILQILRKAESELIGHAEADVLLRHRDAEAVKCAVEVRSIASIVGRETCLFFFSKPTVVAKKARTGTAWLNLTFSSPRGGSLKSLKTSGPDFESSGHQYEGILKRSGSLFPKDKLRLSKMGMNIKVARYTLIYLPGHTAWNTEREMRAKAHPKNSEHISKTRLIEDVHFQIQDVKLELIHSVVYADVHAELAARVTQNEQDILKLQRSCKRVYRRLAELGARMAVTLSSSSCGSAWEDSEAQAPADVTDHSNVLQDDGSALIPRVAQCEQDTIELNDLVQNLQGRIAEMEASQFRAEEVTEAEGEAFADAVLTVDGS